MQSRSAPRGASVVADRVDRREFLLRPGFSGMYLGVALLLGLRLHDALAGPAPGQPILLGCAVVFTTLMPVTELLRMMR